MLRTTVGVSFLVLFGGLSACSSKATDNGTGGGGNGAVLGGSSGSGSGGIGGSGGSGGTRTNTAGTTAANAGTAGSTGGTNGLCADDTITCVDDTQAMGCNPNTGVVETIDCVERYATLGLTSTGCSATAEGEGCDVTDFKDAACLAGAEAYAFCANATDADFVDVYISCFQDFMGSHALVTCLGNYVSATMTTDADCQMAVDVCIDGAGGAGGASGAGGAP